MSQLVVYNYLLSMYDLILQKEDGAIRFSQMAEEIELETGAALEAAREAGVSPEEMASFCLARMIEDTSQISSAALQETPLHRAQRSG